MNDEMKACRMTGATLYHGFTVFAGTNQGQPTLQISSTQDIRWYDRYSKL